jgi:hypothetical protein
VLASSEFFKAVIQDLSAMQAGSDRKLVIYSAHGVTIASILAGMAYYNKEEIPFASTILYELHEDSG